MIEYYLIMRKMTVGKIINFFKRFFSILLSKMFRKLRISGMPWSYSIEPTNLCNLNCRECASGLGLLKRKKGVMSYEDFMTVSDKIAPFALNCFLYFQGEPFLNKDFLKMAEYADKKKIFTATSTNGHFINREVAEKTVLSGLDKIIISFDGNTQENYSAYRKGGDLEKVITAIKELSAAKKRLKKLTPVIEVQTIVNRINENELKNIKRFAFSLGADKFYFKTMQIEKSEDFQVFKTSIDKFSRYDEQNRLKKKVGFCNRILNSAVITIDSFVVVCCYDKDADFRLGNLKDNDLKEILLSENTLKILTAIEFNEKHRPKMCANCGG